MQLRAYLSSDCEQLADLFFQTVHSVNARDYTKQQLDAWATGTVDLDQWNRSFLEHHTVVAVEQGSIVGFGDMTPQGYLDRLYVHRDHQGEGIATAICDCLERTVSTKIITTHASITAKPFFSRRGYRVLRAQTVTRRGVALTNYIMEKHIMSDTKIIIRRATPEDYRTVEALTREAFWNVYRPGCMEHYVLHCFRDDPAFIPELDLVMELDGQMIGHVLYVRSEILCDDGKTLPIVTFGPLSIAPAYQRQGCGKRLVDASMGKARELGAGAVAITGNLLFYGKSGFVPAKEKGIRYADDPEADYFLIRELIPGFLEGVSGSFRDPEGYLVCEKDPEAFARYEATFPPKEKKKLPGQLA